ncbi:MAG TPA: hypothetical protein ENN21_09485 [Spirochaetes bacterium]|nr:hypothetical protein [Spirochaetota bacterium]
MAVIMNILNFFRSKKVGLVLGSGGSRGLAHIAVIQYLESLEIPIHYIAGSSIGAVVGAVYASGNLKEFKDALLKMQKLEMMGYFDPVFPKSGLIEGKKVVDNLLKKYISPDMTIENLSPPVAVVATDLRSGKPVVFKTGNVLEAVRASISIPGIFVPVTYNDTVLVDGGVTNPLPIDVVRKMGATLTVAVNLNPVNAGERLRKKMKKSEPEELDPDRIEHHTDNVRLDHSKIAKGKKDRSWLKSVERWLGIGGKSNTTSLPNIFEVMNRSIDVMGYANTMLMLKFNPPTVLIEPDLNDFSTLDFSGASRAITEGFLACGKVRKQLIKKIKRKL